jgi:hypothetical protein
MHLSLYSTPDIDTGHVRSIPEVLPHPLYFRKCLLVKVGDKGKAAILYTVLEACSYAEPEPESCHNIAEAEPEL